MAEYIVKETLQAKLNRKKTEPANKRYTEGWNDAVLMVKSMIHSEKAADVAPVRHGEWQGEGDGYADGEIVLDVWYCSECGDCIDDGADDPHILPNYCPNCGAKMDGGQT